MFGDLYFGPRYFADRYFGNNTIESVPVFRRPEGPGGGGRHIPPWWLRPELFDEEFEPPSPEEVERLRRAAQAKRDRIQAHAAQLQETAERKELHRIASNRRLGYDTRFESAFKLAKRTD